ncbi:MAG: hypothetical protein DCE86_05435 [Flavobacteriaceae bacterium]|nr:MAG: hypothetical protein DCE86_05435 [Flavobacteriaceae bacterium]
MSEKRAVVIYFPVSPHVYKYLQKKVGEKLVVTKQNFYGNLVLDILSKQSYYSPVVEDDLQFPVEISVRYMTEFGFSINARIFRKFNTQIDHIFREEMRSYVSVCHEANKIQKKEALHQFLVSFNIDEEDIKLETLLKDLVRKI